MSRTTRAFLADLARVGNAAHCTVGLPPWLISETGNFSPCLSTRDQRPRGAMGAQHPIDDADRPMGGAVGWVTYLLSVVGRSV
jgi:hypothetical protein